MDIQDNGPGIPPEIRGRIPSIRLFFTTKPVGEGTGLGLDTVYRIVRQHRGSIRVDSQPGETHFQVRLPFPKGKPIHDDLHASGSDQERQAAHTQAAARSASRWEILWVHLRMCLSCGHVGCCDSSKNRHATKHFHGRRSTCASRNRWSPVEDWAWCFVDEVIMEAPEGHKVLPVLQELL